MLMKRRAFLKTTTGLAMLALMASQGAAREYQGGIPWQPEEALPPDPIRYDERFFTEAERNFITAAVDRLIPKDDFPSASELGVVDFIDSQLAGSYGRGDAFYMQGPFKDGTATQGYQAREPAWLYRTAIAEIEKHVGEKFGGKTFAELEEQEQDALLKDLENGKVALPTVYETTFFDTLWQNTIEGYFGDPIYGGNRNMEAWRMIGFPGARYDYRPYVSRHNEKLDLEPVSVGGYALNPVETRGN